MKKSLLSILALFVVLALASPPIGIKAQSKQQEATMTDPEIKDRDGDGIEDELERKKYKTDPFKKDSDLDGLSDGYEIEINMNPLKKDTNRDGTIDGKEIQTYPLPQNKWGIEGTYSGIGEIKDQLLISDTPILLLQKIKAPLTFDIQVLDAGLTIKLSIPNAQETEKLYRYEYQNKNLSEQQAMLTPVIEQTYDPQKKTIEATVKGGDSFVVLSEQIFQKAFPQQNSVTIPSNKATGNVWVKGLPNVAIDLTDKSGDNEIAITQEGTLYDAEAQKHRPYTYRAHYKIKEIEVANGERYATLTPTTVQTGKPIAIFLHGVAIGDWDRLGGTSESIGFENLWDNRTLQERKASPNWWVPKEKTFTQTEYRYWDYLPYSHPDVQFITKVNFESDPTKNPEKIGPYFVRQGYRVNQDLFIFEYDNDAKNIYWNSELLGDFIENLRRIKIGHSKVNLLTHSMGGLVARYFIENLDARDGDLDVKQLLTFGAPHFGSPIAKKVHFHELVRENSCFWNPKGNAQVKGTCEQLKGTHPGVRYIGFAGTNDKSSGSPRYGFYAVPDETELTDPTYMDWVRKTVNLPSVEWISDGLVSVESALGSDAEVTNQPQKPTLDFDERYLIAHPQFGEHSKMLTNGHIKAKSYIILTTLGW